MDEFQYLVLFDGPAVADDSDRQGPYDVSDEGDQVQRHCHCKTRRREGEEGIARAHGVHHVGREYRRAVFLSVVADGDRAVLAAGLPDVRRRLLTKFRAPVGVRRVSMDGGPSGAMARYVGDVRSDRAGAHPITEGVALRPSEIPCRPMQTSIPSRVHNLYAVHLSMVTGGAIRKGSSWLSRNCLRRVVGARHTNGRGRTRPALCRWQSTGDCDDRYTPPDSRRPMFSDRSEAMRPGWRGNRDDRAMGDPLGAACVAFPPRSLCAASAHLVDPARGRGHGPCRTTPAGCPPVRSIDIPSLCQTAPVGGPDTAKPYYRGR